VIMKGFKSAVPLWSLGFGYCILGWQNIMYR
jgi:hypothetical protein